jgi:hypothetical protein
LGFSVSQKIRVLNTPLRTLVFRPQSCLKSLLAFCDFKCISLRKSALLICEWRFQGCSELATVTFEFPATVHTICLGHSHSVLVCAPSLFRREFRTWGMKELSRVTSQASSLSMNIPAGVFEECRKLEETNLPDSLTTTADTAFVRSSPSSVNGAYCAESLLIRRRTLWFTIDDNFVQCSGDWIASICSGRFHRGFEF